MHIGEDLQDDKFSLDTFVDGFAAQFGALPHGGCSLSWGEVKGTGFRRTLLYDIFCNKYDGSTKDPRYKSKAWLRIYNDAVCQHEVIMKNRGLR